MRVSIIKTKTIDNIILPNEVAGNYWITGTDSNGINRNLISIEAENGKWKLVSNKEVYYVNNNIIQDFAYLNNDCFYSVVNDTEKNSFLLFCSPIESNYKYYEISSSIDDGISIGSKDKSIICYKYLTEKSCMIKRENEKIYVFDVGGKDGIYVNNVRIRNKKSLRTGDILFILGLKIMIFSFKSETGDVLYYIGISDSIKNDVNVKLIDVNLPQLKNTNYSETEEENEYPIYDEGEYFNKMPRFLDHIKPLDLKVDSPPAKESEEGNSLLLTVGPMITMSMTSLVTGYTALNNVLSGDSTWFKAMPSLVICGAMFASVFIWPLFSKKYEKIHRKRKEKERQKKYGEYIENKRQQIVSAKNEQASILNNNYLELNECQEMIINKYTSLWQRKKEDSDFLEVSLGKGTYPMKININYPEEHFSMIEDNLKDMVSKLGNEPKLLIDVPIVFSFLEKKISALIGNKEINGEYFSRILVQLLAYHSYDDLKVIILTDDENYQQWKFLKSVPHLFSNNRNIRFFATNSDEYKEVCYSLSKVFEKRKELAGQSEISIEAFDSYYLIITDVFKKIKDYDVIESVLEEKRNLGFSLFILDEKLTNLPDQCRWFVNIDENKGELHNNDDITNITEFNPDFVTNMDYELISKKLSNIPITFKDDGESQLPNKVGFLEMYDVGKIEQLNANARWEQSNPILNLQAPVGIGKNGDKISLDLHEKYHGPHGLIAGMTGSGKSEFIITYILSMALNYHPYEVQFILIDYKGGGLAGAFENKNIGLKLPHLVGTITNLDANEINRSLASIESELKRRQDLFNKAREASGESTIDIYKYQKMYRDKVVSEPISHLFIISDEFAELKNQQPEFMDQLISTARIGRSLGVHLILATQKPSGVVDPQIWSNTRFRVCMRVQDKGDSNEVIKCNDAAYLKQTGRFYFQVGYNEVFLLGQAAWAGGKYIPNEKVNKMIDTSINFINNVGYNIKNIETRVKKETISNTNGEELLNVVKYLSSIATEQNIKCKPLWLEMIPADIRIENLITKYKYQKEAFIINPIIGEYDVPSNQEQRLLTLPLSKEGNATIYGASGSGKENFVTTMIYSSMISSSPEEVNYYIIDFGSESLKMFNNCALVGDILTSEDEEKIDNLFKMISSTIEKRKELFINYNGDYNTYCKNSGKTLPNMVIVINNYESFQETYSQFDDTLIVLSRDANRYGIYFVLMLNTPNGIRFKLKQNFALTYALQQNNEDDYTTILGNIHKQYPAKIFGRGILKINDVYEFQTALVTEVDKIPQYIKEYCTSYNEKYEGRARKIPILPNSIEYNTSSKEFNKTGDIIIGMNKYDLSINKFDFNRNFATVVSSLDIISSSTIINSIINQVLSQTDKNLLVINAEDYNINKDYILNYQYVDKDFNDVFNSLTNFINTQYDNYVTSNYDKKIFEDKKIIFCIIIGVDNFKNRLNDDNKLKFGDLFIKAKDLGIIDYVFVDSIDKIKKIELESWYKNSVNQNSGIWIGNGINDQFSIKISQKVEEMKEEITDDFCFVIKKGKAQFVKYISNFNIDIIKKEEE